MVSHFANHHTYLPTGRYQVTLPRKTESWVLGESRKQPLQRFQTNERSIMKRGTWKAFQEVIQQYLDLGHAEPVTSDSVTNLPNEHYYLPVHGVTKSSSTTTKLRVVFDASAKTSTNISLTDILMVGPTLYKNLVHIVLKFRSYRLAISGDVSKIYRAVQLHEKDRDLHRFLWRANTTGPFKDYRMTRVTFGVASSAFAAVQALRQTALEFWR